MSTWNYIKAEVGKAANKTAKKANELAETAAQHIKLKSMSANLSSLFEVLGKLTYKQLKSGQSQAEEIAKVLEAIDKQREDIKALKKRIEEEKEARAKHLEAPALEPENTGKENGTENTEN